MTRKRPTSPVDVVPFRSRADIQQAEIEVKLAQLSPYVQRTAKLLMAFPDYTYPETWPKKIPPPAPGPESAIAAAEMMEAICYALVSSGYFRKKQS
jgi:hypothetical protein